MARKPARRKAGARKAPGKRATRPRGRTAGAKRKVRPTRPRKAAAKTRAKAKGPVRKRAAAKRAAPKPKLAPPTLGQIPLGSYTTPPPVSPVEPMRHDPWERPVEHHGEDTGMEDEEEDEEPL